MLIIYVKGVMIKVGQSLNTSEFLYPNNISHKIITLKRQYTNFDVKLFGESPVETSSNVHLNFSYFPTWNIMDTVFWNMIRNYILKALRLYQPFD